MRTRTSRSTNKKTKARYPLIDYLSGGLLREFFSDFRNVRVVLFAVGLVMVHITSGHWINKKLGRIAKLKVEVRDLRNKSLALSTIITQNSRRSQVEKIVTHEGLPIHTPNAPIIVIE